MEEFLRSKLAREPKTYAAYRGVLLGSGRPTSHATSGYPTHWPRTSSAPAPITAKTINAALDRAAAWTGILVKVTAHTAKHTSCTSWITEKATPKTAWRASPAKSEHP